VYCKGDKDPGISGLYVSFASRARIISWPRLVK